MSTVELTEEDRDLILLALAILSLYRPGWLFACQEVADVVGGMPAQEMFKKFRRLNEDRVRLDPVIPMPEPGVRRP